MINWKANKDYISFSLTVSGKEIPYSHWNEDDEGAIYADILQEALDNGLAHIESDELKVSYDFIYSMTTYERSALTLPNLYPYVIVIQPKGLLKDKSFQYAVSFRETKLGRRFKFNREYAVLSNKENKYLLQQSQYQLIESIDEYNNIPFEGKTFNGNLIAFDRLKNLSNNAAVVLDKYLKSENVFVPSKLKIEVDRIDNDLYEVVPTIDSPLSAQFDRYLDTRDNAPDNIALTDDNNDRVRVVLDDNKRKTIDTIRNNYHRATSKQLKKLIDNPSSELNPDDCDLSVFYSDRVIKIGLYRPKIYPFVSPFKSSWLPPSYTIEDRVNGTTQLTFATEKELDNFELQVRTAIAKDEPSLTYKNILLNVNDALSIAKDARKKFEEKKERDKKKEEEKKVLIVEENAESLGYKVDFRKEAGKKNYTFFSIPGLNPMIKLKEHQIQGIAWLQNLVNIHAKGCLLADDMGLGKTLQLLSLIDWYDKNHPDSDRPYLIVAPISLLENWQQEYKKFFLKPRIPVRVVTSKFAKHFKKTFDGTFIMNLRQHQIILTNYETVRSYQMNFCAVDYSVIVLDEAQKVKTPGTLVTNSVKALKGEFKVAMTGTPVENTIVDLWCIMDFAVPGLLGNCKEFAAKYQAPLKSEDTDIIQIGNEVRKNLGKYFLRRLKSDVAKELPEKHIRYMESEMPKVQRDAYVDVIHQAIRERDSAEPAKGYMLMCIQKLRAISDHPYLGQERLFNTSVDELIATSAKLQAIIPVLDSIRNKKEKVILFAERRDTQLILKRVLKIKYNIDAHIINGDTPTISSEMFTKGKLSRQQAIDDFQDKNGFNAIIMSPIAAGTGLNVTEANHVIHYSRHWNPAKENQATDRVYRIGQTKDVFVYYPMAVSKGINTFDQTLDKLLKQKSKLADATLFPSARIEVNSEELFNALVS